MRQETQPAAPGEADAAPEPDLERQYRKIGIPAVAATLPYKGANKNPAYARGGEAANYRHEHEAA